MASFNYETLESLEMWIKDWERLIDNNLEDIILSINFRNLIVYSNKRLINDRRKDLLQYSVPYLQMIIKSELPRSKLRGVPFQLYLVTEVL